MHTTHEHNLASAVLMVAPVDFAYNAETASDNEFMKNLGDVRDKALKEFNQSVEALRSTGIEVVVFDKRHYPELEHVKTPDAVFPNNWFSSENDTLWLYRMRNVSRSLEKLQITEILPMLHHHGYNVKGTRSWNKSVIEGTGVLIFDRKFKRVYVNKSQRAESHLEDFGAAAGYEAVVFQTKSSTGQPFYHTNVMLSIGQSFAVVSTNSIVEKDRQRVLSLLKEGGRDVIQLTEKQAETDFCANVLQLRNREGKRVLVLSDKAYKGFTKQQLECLKQKHVDLFAVFPLEVIEEVGGGSARCMIAELFLSKV